MIFWCQVLAPEGEQAILSLNRNQIKYIVILAMLIDHIAWAFVPLASWQGQIMHMIGRLTGPTMAYFIAEGYVHTRSVKKYAKRLAIFAVISWIPFTFFEYGHLPIYKLNGNYTFEFSPGVIYTLFLALLAIWVWDKGTMMEAQKKAIIAFLCILSIWGDWPIFDILYAMCFFCYRKDEKKKWSTYTLLSVCSFVFGGFGIWGIYQLGVLLVPLLLHYTYNGKAGSKKPIHKWFFYVFYPLHLFVLGLLKIL